MTDAVVGRLRQIDFPDNCRAALDELAGLVYNAQNIAGFGGQSSKSHPLTADEVAQGLASRVAAEFIFGCKPSRGNKVSKGWTAIQQLQVLEILCSYLEQEQPQSSHPSSPDQPPQALVFRLLFCVEGASLDGDVWPVRRDMLCKLVSVAVATQAKRVLECVAFWIQVEGCSSPLVSMVMQTLVKDFCESSSEENRCALAQLPKLSPHFTCSFITAVVGNHQPPGSTGQSPTIPHSLLSMVTDWIETDPRLCLLSLSSALAHKAALWTSPSKPNTHTPIPSLLRWSTRAPCCHKNKEHWQELWSRLHLGLLQTVMCFPTLPGANQLELITLTDMRRMVKDVVAMCKKTEATEDDKETAGNRLVQVLQVSLATGAFRCSLSDLRSICESIPPNRLLSIVMSQHLSIAPPQMHNVS